MQISMTQGAFMTQKIIENRMKIIKRSLFAAVGILIAVVLVMSAYSQNEIKKLRTDGEYTVAESVAVSRKGDGTNRITECRFVLGEVSHADTLAFYISHHDVKVTIGTECVYEQTAGQDDRFRTGGGAWVVVPLYPEDAKKEVTVCLTPLYDGYQTDVPEFMIGSELAIHNATFHRALPAMVLGLCVIFTGLLLICLAIWNSAKNISVGRVYALGFMAVAAGVWRISYDRLAFILLPDHAVLIYTASVISLMGVALAMLNSLDTTKKGREFITGCSCIYCGIYMIQLFCQMAGIADLRQTLKLIHMTIVISAIAFVVSGITKWFRPGRKKHGETNFGWILGVGVLIDLLLYYADSSSFNMIFTLSAILCYSVLEGIHMLLLYIEQKNELKEMETQLTLSRTTTMMSQIRSHFVFNVLNAISGMCKYDPVLADDTVVRFARYLRNNIDIMEKDGNIPFSTDLRQLEDYVALEQARFGEKIEFYTDIETEDFKIPPLILQPIVENAIKHGISKKQGNGMIIVRTRDNGDHIIITVEDDGIGFDVNEPEKEQSVGIRNIRFRLQHLAGGTLKIESEKGRGTTVTIILPKEAQ